MLYLLWIDFICNYQLSTSGNFAVEDIPISETFFYDTELNSWEPNETLPQSYLLLVNVLTSICSYVPMDKYNRYFHLSSLFTCTLFCKTH